MGFFTEEEKRKKRDGKKKEEKVILPKIQTIEVFWRILHISPIESLDLNDICKSLLQPGAMLCARKAPFHA